MDSISCTSVALDMVNGKHPDQFKYARDYALAVMKWNLGSRVMLHLDGRVFYRMYVRLEVCKVGWLASCRPIISVDACHLKGPFVGQLFCAVVMFFFAGNQYRSC